MSRFLRALLIAIFTLAFSNSAAWAQEAESDFEAIARGPHCIERCIRTHNAAIAACFRQFRRDTGELRECVREAERDLRHCLLSCRPGPVSP